MTCQQRPLHEQEEITSQRSLRRLRQHRPKAARSYSTRASLSPAVDHSPKFAWGY